MNLNKALKLKKKLVKKSNDFFTKFQSSNSIDITQNETPDYDPKEMYERWKSCIDELITLKSKIHIANQPIASKIFKLGELKSMVQHLRNVNTKSGKQRISPYASEMTEYKAWMSKVDIDNHIEDLEYQIEQIQEEIEAFNAITKI